LPRNLSAYQAYLEQTTFPYVVIDPDNSKTDHSHIQSLNWQGAFEATKHLCILGHRRIAFIKGRSDVASAFERFEAFQVSLSEAQVPFDNNLVFDGDFTKEKGYEVGELLFTMNDPPTAVFCANDEMALGVMDAALDRELSIPDDISIIGFDDIPQARYVRPQLTTVKQDMHQMGRLAIQLLIDHIENGVDEPKQLKLETQLIMRGSTAPPK
ncbi:MAG: substrate-binding domain-containing protein, partial [Chloroflexota bacterium]